MKQFFKDPTACIVTLDRETKSKLNKKAIEMGYTNITEYYEVNRDDIRLTEKTIYGVSLAGREGYGQKFHFAHQTQATIFGNDYLMWTPFSYCHSSGRYSHRGAGHYAFEPLTETNKEITCKKCLKDFGTVSQQLERRRNKNDGLS